MAAFRYRGTTAAGEIRQGVIEAPSRDAALARVRSLGLSPIEATETKADTEARSGAGAAPTGMADLTARGRFLLSCRSNLRPARAGS